MPVGNGGEAIAIMDTSNPALPSCASSNGASVQVIANAVGFKIRSVPGVPQHRKEGVLDANGLASKKAEPLYTTIARCVTGEKAYYDQGDIQYAFLSMHANACKRVCSTLFLAMSRLQLICIYGNSEY
jgi:hypothetical protein